MTKTHSTALHLHQGIQFSHGLLWPQEVPLLQSVCATVAVGLEPAAQPDCRKGMTAVNAHILP